MFTFYESQHGIRATYPPRDTPYSVLPFCNITKREVKFIACNRETSRIAPCLCFTKCPEQVLKATVIIHCCKTNKNWLVRWRKLKYPKIRTKLENFKLDLCGHPRISPVNCHVSYLFIWIDDTQGKGWVELVMVYFPSINLAQQSLTP